jgi:aspartate/methionine/tyrosine aminotransferase
VSLSEAGTPPNAWRLAPRNAGIDPFYVMEVGKAADQLANQLAVQPGAHHRRVVRLNIGEPDHGAAPAVRQAAAQALQDGALPYTAALGLPELRQRIAHWYTQHHGITISPSRVVVTAGASAALQLACLALVGQDDEVLIPDPSYPCNRNFVHAVGGQAVALDCPPEQRYQPTGEQVAQAWGARTRALLLASPSNPTGTSLNWDELERLAQVVRQRHGLLLADEIYTGLSFDPAYGRTALGLAPELAEHVVSVNSFSKYFGMTGWRLGWLVLPERLVPAVEKLAQNLYICPSTLSQRAALACFEPSSLAWYEQRRLDLQQRRDAVLPRLQAVGLEVPVAPDGAFYIWANCRSLCQRLGIAQTAEAGSWALAFALLERAQVALAPGRDFGQRHTHHFVRLSLASSMDDWQEALLRLESLA